MAELQAELQRLSGTTRDATGAANAWAGTTGLELVGALNAKAGTVGLDLNAAFRAAVGATSGEAQSLAGTTVNTIRLPGTAGNYASTPDSAALSITGDIDIRVKMAADDWTPAAEQIIADKWGSDGQRSWFFYRNTTGRLRLGASTNGSTGFFTTSTASVSASDGGALWVRVTRASASGDQKFYTSPDGTTWTQLGTTVASTTGALFDGNTEVRIGGENNVGLANMAGNVYYAEIRNGIDGTVVATFNPTSQAVTGVRSPSSWAGPQGNTWTVNGSDWSWAGRAA